MKNPSKAVFISSILIFVVIFSHLTSTASQEVGNAEIKHTHTHTHAHTWVLCFPFYFLLNISIPSICVFHGAIISESLYAAEDEREFDCLEESEIGPRHWGDIRKEWAACKNGDMQSPIDLSSQRLKLMPKLGKLRRNYKLGNATIKNRGHDISVRKESCQTVIRSFVYGFPVSIHFMHTTK